MGTEDPPDGAAIPDLYRNGASIRDLARLTGLPYRRVRRLLDDAGVKVRQPGEWTPTPAAARHRSAPPKGTPAREQLAKTLRDGYEAGDSIRTLMRWHDLGYGTVHGLLREAGARLRPRGGVAKGGRR